MRTDKRRDLSVCPRLPRFPTRKPTTTTRELRDKGHRLNMRDLGRIPQEIKGNSDLKGRIWRRGGDSNPRYSF